jgi:ribosome biogenesis GTPase A
MYRTGKSYLINKLLKNKEKGFKTGSTVQAVTKGLNIWGSPIITKDEN